MNAVIDSLLGVVRVIVREHERMIVLEDGRFTAILDPGEHKFWGHSRQRVFERHDINRLFFQSVYDPAVLRARPDLAEGALMEIRTEPGEVALIEQNGRLIRLQGPDQRCVVWTEAGPWRVTRLDAESDLEIAPKLARRLVSFDAGLATRAVVAANQIGLLFVDGAYVRLVEPGAHAFWSVGRRIEVRLVDLRRRALDVTGQEILTKDRVSIRVNLAAHYRVVDPEKAVVTAGDYADALHRALQYAFRKTLGAKTLDEILEQKVTVDAEPAERVRREMAELGLEVGEIALKDVILPGEMREILNRVVEAQKEAEANVIRRREETAATRSLLNTAKVMAENPIMLRLKELEALETIADRVDRLVIHNGPKGLLNEVASLSDD